MSCACAGAAQVSAKLVRLLAAADVHVLQKELPGADALGHVPFLLQPLTKAPALIQVGSLAEKWSCIHFRNLRAGITLGTISP